MKRNLQLIVLLLLAFTTITSGQQMIEEGNNWNVVDYFWTSGNTNNYSIESDTMVNGILYKQVHLNGEPINTNEFSKTPKYIRETDDGKVFSEDNLQPWDGVDEVLIYDFGLMPGDTFSVGFPNIPAWGSDLVVLSVDTIVLSDGISRRRLVLEGEKPWTLQPTTWVEGIGDVDLGPFHAHLYYTPESFAQLLCSYQDEELVFQNPDSDSCFVTITTSIQELEKTSPIKIFPNPFVDFLTIEYLERDHHFTEITIFNSLGQMVHQQKDELIITKVNTSQLTTGIYYLVLKDNAGAHFSHRMIKR